MSTAATGTGLKPEVRGWLRHIWRKATTDDDWSRTGEAAAELNRAMDRYARADAKRFPSPSEPN